MFKLLVIVAICTNLVIKAEAGPVLGVETLDDFNTEILPEYPAVLDGAVPMEKRSINVNTDPLVKLHKHKNESEYESEGSSQENDSISEENRIDE